MRVVVMVAVEEVPKGATPVTVTNPVFEIETIPLAVAVPPYANAGS